jgi:16S rRNA (cytidine1402-2'-O)-methyltransferase
LLKKLKLGKDVALISDAGTPTLSDPGFRLIRACRREGITVLPVPGASAAMAALSVSGLPTMSFLFLGFLSPKSSARRQVFQQYKTCPHTLIFYESCHRIEKFILEAKEEFGDSRWACVAREMTKLHEAYVTCTLGEISAKGLHLPAKGEFVILVANQNFAL